MYSVDYFIIGNAYKAYYYDAPTSRDKGQTCDFIHSIAGDVIIYIGGVEKLV